MNRADILRKIKACLRLAASSNPNEASSALRQAQAMMAQHGVTAAEVSDVGEAEVTTRYRGQTPPQSICMLVNLCADGFGASVVLVSQWRKTVIRFYGIDGSAEIAAYAFTVLRRQLDRDRLAHISRVRKRGNREARGEAFAQAWVSSVTRLFPSAAMSDAARLAIDDVLRLRHPQATTTPGRDLTTRGSVRDNDHWAGHSAGRKAQLHRGVGSPEPKALEHSS
jgi:hypothetical protein